MAGRPPSVDPVRRNARVGPLKLPAGGRQGDTPVWPLPGGATAETLALWAQLWHTPQAVAWEHLEWTRVVARYTLIVQAAERLEREAMTEARQLEDRLGLTPKSMRLLLWEVVSDELADVRTLANNDARKRIKAVG